MMTSGIKEVEGGIDAAGGVNDGGDEEQVGEHLQPRLQAGVAPEGRQQDEEGGDGIPENDDADEELSGSSGRSEGADRQLDAQQESNDDDPYLDQPLQPGTFVNFSPHSTSDTRAGTTRVRDKFRAASWGRRDGAPRGEIGKTGDASRRSLV